MFGHRHEPIDQTVGFVVFGDVEFLASICKHCEKTIVFDEQCDEWIEW